MACDEPTRKEEVGRRFSRAATRYDALARHQAIAAQRLTERLQGLPEPRNLLDLGCGTGLLTRHLVALHPQARFTVVDLAPEMLRACRARHLRDADATVEADAETWWPDHPVDACVSSCALQWFQHPGSWIRFARERLAPGGWLAAVFPVEGTLHEFAACAPAGTPLLAMPSAEAWERRFRQVSWRSLDVVAETLTLTYASALDILRALHGIGATCTAPGAVALRPSAVRRLTSDYEERFRTPEGVPCTYQLLYVIATT